jgi:hypothetical protein
MENKSNTNQDILEQVLAMHEAGIPIAKILKKFPEEERMIKGVFDTIDILKRESLKMNPSPEGLQNILNKISVDTNIASPYLTISWFKRYGVYMSAGVLAMLLIFINTSPKSPTQIAQNSDSATMSTFGVENSPAGLSAPMNAKFGAPSGNVDQTVQEINAIMLAENDSAATEARDASLASYDQSQFNSYATDNYENNL